MLSKNLEISMFSQHSRQKKQSSVRFDKIKSQVQSSDSEKEVDLPEESEELDISLCKRTTLPPTGDGNVDKFKLKQEIARAGLELEMHIIKGKMPMFGYPMVNFSGTQETPVTDKRGI